jgi:excisionase family DNA binding protein
MNQLREFWSVREAAELLGVSPQTVRMWVKDGRLGVVRLAARSTRIPSDEIMRLLGRSVSAVAEESIRA